VAGEQASGVMNRFGGQREGRSSLESFSTVERISGGEETVASRSRGSPAGSERLGRMYSAARCSGWGQDGRRKAGVDCPWWLGSAGEERRWWSGGAAEGTGKEVGGVLGVGPEIGAVTAILEGDRGSVSRWLNDGGMTAQWRQWAEEEKGSSRGGVLLLKAA
jgi:hypothetical protein